MLVVVIILAILAAIAIPVYLNQREQARQAAVRADLRSAKVALEAYRAAEDRYDAVALTGLPGALVLSPSINMNMDAITADGYCVSAHHDGSTAWYWVAHSYGSIRGPADTEPC